MHSLITFFSSGGLPQSDSTISISGNLAQLENRQVWLVSRLLIAGGFVAIAIVFNGLLAIRRFSLEPAPEKNSTSLAGNNGDDPDLLEEQVGRVTSLRPMSKSFSWLLRRKYRRLPV